jgi:hypothetical protein
VTDADGVPDLRERIVAHAPELRLRELRSVGVFVVMLPLIAVAEIDRHGLTAYAAFLLIATLVGVYRITVGRRGTITEAAIEREVARARPCAECGTQLAWFEHACPRCRCVRRQFHRDMWMPLLIILAFALCIAAAIGLSR